MMGEETPKEKFMEELPPHDRELINGLREADVILVTAAPWDEDAALVRKTALNAKRFPPLSGNDPSSDAVGNISLTFLRADGSEDPTDYREVGLDFKGFHQVAQRGTVILLCGGKNGGKYPALPSLPDLSRYW